MAKTRFGTFNRWPPYAPWIRRQTELLGLPVVQRLKRRVKRGTALIFGDDYYLGPRFYHRRLLALRRARLTRTLAKAKRGQIVQSGDLYDPARIHLPPTL